MKDIAEIKKMFTEERGKVSLYLVVKVPIWYFVQ